MVTKKEIDAKWREVERLLGSTFAGSGEDTRLGNFQTEAEDLTDEDLADFLDDAIEVLEDQDKKARRKRLVELARPEKQGSDDDETTPKERRKVLLEDKASAQKRTLAARFLETCGGKDKAYKASKGLTDFLANASLPHAYDARLTKLTNESHVAMKAIGILKSGKAVTPAELSQLGEIMLAETAAKVFVLYAAYHKEVIEGVKWADPHSLQSSIDTQQRNALSVALKDATGDATRPSIGDIFTPVSESSSARKNEGKPAISVATPGWVLEKPKAFSDHTVQCRTCRGWAHKADACRQSPGFRGWCSRCHGKGHKMNDCPSK